MFYGKVDCPNCGNTVNAKFADVPQKCRWCRRLFRINTSEGIGKKESTWKAEPVEFSKNK